MGEMRTLGSLLSRISSQDLEMEAPGKETQNELKEVHSGVYLKEFALPQQQTGFIIYWKSSVHTVFPVQQS